MLYFLGGFPRGIPEIQLDFDRSIDFFNNFDLFVLWAPSTDFYVSGLFWKGKCSSKRCSIFWGVFHVDFSNSRWILISKFRKSENCNNIFEKTPTNIIFYIVFFNQLYSIWKSRIWRYRVFLKISCITQTYSIIWWSSSVVAPEHRIERISQIYGSHKIWSRVCFTNEIIILWWRPESSRAPWWCWR